jgi:hypothetical protein
MRRVSFLKSSNTAVFPQIELAPQGAQLRADLAQGRGDFRERVVSVGGVRCVSAADGVARAFWNR